MEGKTLLYVVNAAEYFVSHRMPIAQKAKELGCSVHVASTGLAGSASEAIKIIEEQGFTYHDIPLKRGGQNPLVELWSLVKLYILMRQLSPDVVHLVTLKPVLYGGLAARFSGVKSVVAAVAGLGTIFIAQSRIAKMRRWLVIRFLKLAFSSPGFTAIFQNPDDRDDLLARKVLTPSQTKIIRGSGVSLEKYPYTPEPAGKSVIVMASRLLKDKGVLEFFKASEILKDRNVVVELRLIGDCDPRNPTSLTPEEAEAWGAKASVKLLGFRSDIADQYAAANVVCLPSYREGLPKSLVEAAACGRAVVTTNVPGCRDAIIPNKTGLLVPVRDAGALADALQSLLEAPDVRREMGAEGRRLAESEFLIEKIVEQHLSIYEKFVRAQDDGGTSV